MLENKYTMLMVMWITIGVTIIFTPSATLPLILAGILVSLVNS